MSLTNLIKIDTQDTLEFTKKDSDALPKATLNIASIYEGQNVAFKIKTTDPKLFVVKPIQGVLSPGASAEIEILLQIKELTNPGEILKKKFMVQASMTDLNASEGFNLSKFWDDKAKSKDKSTLQQAILKVSVDKLDLGAGKS